MTPDALPYAFGALFLSGLLVLAYRKDIREARLFKAMRRAAKHPYADRAYHKAFALRHKLFWGPCPNCGSDFGGHEMTGKTVPHPDPRQAARGVRKPLCPPCSLSLRYQPSSKNLKDYSKIATRRPRKD